MNFLVYKNLENVLSRCLRELGQNNSAFIAILLPKLLPMHSYLDVQEPQFSKIDRLYFKSFFFESNNSVLFLPDTCALILVLNAALHHPSIISVLPDYVFRHYRYLRTKEPDLTPNLQIQLSKTIDLDLSLPVTIPSSHDVFERILKLSEQGHDLHSNDQQKFYRNLAMYDVQSFTFILILFFQRIT
jgi:hypothetical protein